MYPIATLKARLLAGGTIILSEEVSNQYPIYKDNHHNNPWIFLSLSLESRVRLTVTNEKPAFLLKMGRDKYLSIVDLNTNEVVVEKVGYEEAIIHAPEQLFLGMYEYCKIGCKFCPFSVSSKKIHYSLDSIYADIDNAFDKPFTSIGITTSIPPHLSDDDVADEMIFIVKKIREKVGLNIPLGISTKIPTREKLVLLKEAGVNEVRLNIEVPNIELSKQLMLQKPLVDILESVKMACQVFGHGKVSSNIVVGLGESDDDVLYYIEVLAKLGAIATLYPYDPIETSDSYISTLKRPSAERLFSLAVKHKQILDKYNLDTRTLQTMCPACAASHILPGRDL